MKSIGGLVSAMVVPARTRLRRRSFFAAAAIGAVWVAAGCSSPASLPAPTAVENEGEDTEFRDPTPRRAESPDRPPDGSYPVGPPRRVAYRVAGPGSQYNFGDLYVPMGRVGPLPVVVMIHGGGWTMPTGLDYMGPLARDVAAFGVAVWNIEYRRVHGGGGWPTTLTDVAAAVDAVADLRVETGADLDAADAHVIGHSAGGHLAAWVAGRPTFRPGSPGAEPRVRVRSGTIMAGVLDLALADDHRRDPFVHGLLGGSDDQVPRRYAFASPITHLPTGIPVTCLHGAADTVVLPEQSRTYVRAATAAGDPAALVMLPGVDHTAFGDVTSVAWRTARDRLLEAVVPR